MARIPGQAETCQAESVDVRTRQDEAVSVGQEVARKYGATPDRHVVAALRVLLGRMGGGRGDGGK